MDKYINRQDAGKKLAQALQAYGNSKDIIILALPRGGVPVAYEVAKALHIPMDVFIVRKLGVPEHSELAMGAIAMGGISVFNEDIVGNLHISPQDIENVIISEKQELKRREKAYRGNHVFPPLKNKTIILIDDGIATGASMRAAITALRQLNPAKIVVAVPVAQKSMCNEMEPLTDELICPLQPVSLYAVGAWYEDFAQTEDEEVYALLKDARKFASV